MRGSPAAVLWPRSTAPSQRTLCGVEMVQLATKYLMQRRREQPQHTVAGEEALLLQWLQT